MEHSRNAANSRLSKSHHQKSRARRPRVRPAPKLLRLKTEILSLPPPDVLSVCRESTRGLFHIEVKETHLRWTQANRSTIAVPVTTDTPY